MSNSDATVYGLDYVLAMTLLGRAKARRRFPRAHARWNHESAKRALVWVGEMGAGYAQSRLAT